MDFSLRYIASISVIALLHSTRPAGRKNISNEALFFSVCVSSGTWRKCHLLRGF